MIHFFFFLLEMEQQSITNESETNSTNSNSTTFAIKICSIQQHFFLFFRSSMPSSNIGRFTRKLQQSSAKIRNRVLSSTLVRN